MADGGSFSADYSFTTPGFPGGGGDCPATLAPGVSCLVEIEFTPGSLGVLASTMSITYGNGVAPQTLNFNVTGEGANPAALTISEVDTFNFGDVTVSATTNHLFTISNTGGVIATSIAESTLGAPFTFRGGFLEPQEPVRQILAQARAVALMWSMRRLLRKPITPQSP